MRALLRIDRTATRVGGIGVTVALMAGCVAAGSLTAPPDASSPGPPSPTRTATSVPSPIASANCGTANWSIEYAPYTIAGLAANGDILVAGVATALEPAVFNTADGKPPRGFFARHDAVPDAQEYVEIFTPVVIEVERVFAGDVKPGTLRADVEGGTLGCWTVTVDAPRVELKTRYVFDLKDYGDADGKVVPGQHKVFLALPIDANDVVQQGGIDVFGNPANEGPMSLATLAQLAAKAASTPAP